MADGASYVGKRVTKMTAFTYAKLIKALQEKPQSSHTIAEITGLHHITVSIYLRALHQEQAVHVSRWGEDRKGREQTPYFALGFGLDKPRRVKSKAEVQRDYMIRKKAKSAEYPLKPRESPMSQSGKELMKVWSKA